MLEYKNAVSVDAGQYFMYDNFLYLSLGNVYNEETTNVIRYIDNCIMNIPFGTKVLPVDVIVSLSPSIPLVNGQPYVESK